MEVDSLEQLQQLLTLHAGVVDIILLDNMQPETMREAVKMRDAANPSLQLEASGGEGALKRLLRLQRLRRVRKR